MAKVGDLRIYRSHSGKSWIIQKRSTAVGLIAALHGGGEMWVYADKTFKSRKEGLQYLAKHS